MLGSKHYLFMINHIGDLTQSGVYCSQSYRHPFKLLFSQSKAYSVNVSADSIRSGTLQSVNYYVVNVYLTLLNTYVWYLQEQLQEQKKEYEEAVAALESHKLEVGETRATLQACQDALRVQEQRVEAQAVSAEQLQVTNRGLQVTISDLEATCRKQEVLLLQKQSEVRFLAALECRGWWNVHCIIVQTSCYHHYNDDDDDTGADTDSTNHKINYDDNENNSNVNKLHITLGTGRCWRFNSAES